MRHESPLLPVLKLVVAIGALALLLHLTGTWGLLALGLLAGAAVIFVFVFVLLSYGQVVYQNWLSPRRRVQAEAVRRKTRENFWGEWAEELPIPIVQARFLLIVGQLILREILTRSRFDYWITFRVGDQELDFNVPEHVYLNILEGDRGFLYYRGERFLGFQAAPDLRGPSSAGPRPAR